MHTDVLLGKSCCGTHRQLATPRACCERFVRVPLVYGTGAVKSLELWAEANTPKSSRRSHECSKA